MRTAKRSELGAGVLAVILLFAGGCEFFGGNQDEEGFDEETGSEPETTGEEPPPERGFRVFPKFMLQDVPAIVTIDVDGVSSDPCPLDDAAEGGYLCDADALPPDSLATIQIERDGFDMAVRHPEVPFNQIVPLEVHLAVEGGPTGSWSPCTAAGEFETCDDLCATFVGSCVVTSCATDDPEWPLATYQSFADAECTTLGESVVDACDNSLPDSGSVAALRCCCAT